ncbi:Fur family transcriptional regulator [Geothermobacter hydrogeniphilus]|uniref:Fur family transcriptional regulator n=1 Tax=Geothermobacter hydrogeniphilus TaxID=1969733 RepID=A0A1X0XJ67_9BACT|nr:Fur family transcriptional regulator [Geothermobacter hydrogeniphilus]ORJ52931.1 Fur family transcriptional regulator [Geothermobacter hydrogeniphilus]
MSQQLADHPFTPHDHQQCIDQAMARAEALCRRQRARLTPLRRRVLELLWQSHRPVGAYELLEQLRTGSRAAPPTVYRALDFLQRVGLAHRLASLNAYTGCCYPGEPHAGQFLICRSCQASSELSSAGVSRSIRQATAAAGFSVEQQTVEIHGLCSRCRED